MSKALRILILEDRAADAELVTRELRKAGFEFVAKTVATEKEFLAELRSYAPELILADYSLPGYDGLSALAAAQKQCPETPFIFVSGSLGEEKAIDTLHQGATDYVLKQRLARLGPAVRRALREREEMRKREQAEKERHEAEVRYRALFEQSRESEEQLRAMFDLASIGVASADPRTAQWLRVNQKMCAITGYSASEMLRMRIPELTHPDDRQKDWEAFQRVVRGEAPDYRLEKRYIRKDGAVAWVNVNVTVIRDAAGQPMRTMATIEDITERKQAEQALRENDRRYRLLFNSGRDAVFVHDGPDAQGRPGEFLEVNDVACQRLGYTREELLQMSPFDIETLEGAQAIPGIVKRLEKEKHATWEAINVTKGGRQFPVEISSQLFQLNGKPAYLSTIRDITERKQAEVALRRREEYFRALTEKATDVTTVLNADGTIQYQSLSVEQVFGYQPNELVGRSAFDLIHPEDLARMQQALAESVATPGSTTRIELRFRRKDNSWCVLESTSRNLLDDPNVKGIIINSRDMTERRVLEEQLRQSQKMEAVGQLAGGVAHDFNNMLAVIRGNAELLLMDEGQHTAETREGLKHVVAASERAANLTRQLLAFSRKQVLQPQPLVLNEVIANLTKMLHRVLRENINLQCQYAAPLAYVQADTGMIEQVILNLVVNARDAMPQGGQLRLATGQLTLDEAYARVNPEARAGEFVCLLVSDTGTGIAPGVLPRIFEPFFTTKELGKGTGLGLATVYGIVKQHQGWIEVSSQVGVGSTFTVFLPAIATPARLAEAAAAGVEVLGGKETILLVEDEHAVRLTTRRVLESKSYTVREATSAREALELWQSHAGEIALLLTDIVMPGEMTGRDLAERLWEQRPGLKVVFMSGYSAEVLGKGTDFIRRTRSYFLEKPSTSRAILETVRQCLDQTESVAAPGKAG